MASRRVSGGGVFAIGVLCWLSACGGPGSNLFDNSGGGASQAAGNSGEHVAGAAGKSSGAAGHPGSVAGAAGAASAAGSSGEAAGAGSGGADRTGEGGSAVGGEPAGGDPGMMMAGSGGATAGTGGTAGMTAGMGGTAAGTGGTSGTAGSGGAPPKPVGSKCSMNSDCELGFCTDGVCCESACHGACKACSTAGKCNLQPIDDEACGNIACPADTACKDYPNNITTNRCASFGVCKNAAACTFTAKPVRTPCSQTGPELCDAQANCTSPSVNCGGATCPVNNSVCCGNAPSTFACVAKSNGLECLNMGGAISCDENGDCPTGPCPMGTTCTQYSATAPTAFSVCK